MSSPYEDKPGADDTSPPAGAVTTTTAPAPALVSISGPVAPAGEGTWCNGRGLYARYAGRTAVGLVREHNEDNFVIANLTSGEVSERETVFTDCVGNGGLLFAVCDGMGGAAAGEVASQMAVDVLLEAMRRGGAPGERDVLARRLVSAVEEAGRRIFDSAQKERSRRGMGTTATAAVLVDKVLFLAEVGDSRAYLLRAGQLKQLTKDQSLVNQLIEAGHLTEAEAEAFEHSNIILQALGTSETVQVDLTFVELRRGDRLMMCSDGLSGLVHGDTLRDTLSGIDDPAECTAALVRFAEAGGGHDNITVVVIDFDGDALELPRETDTFGYLQYPLVPAASAASTFSEEEVTEATKPLSTGQYDAVPSYHPPAGPGVDTSPWLWVSAGLAALLVGTWLLAVGGSAGSAVSSLEEVTTDDSNVAPAEPTQAPAPAAAEPAATGTGARAEVKGVPVNVHSDVEDAVLLVNGESHGPLATGQGQSLELPPGAYRFEAQSKGNTAAVEVVNVRPDASPLDVFLRLPAGANGPAKAGQPTPPKSPEAPSQAAQKAPEAQPAAPAQPAADAPKAPLSEPAKTQAPQTPPTSTAEPKAAPPSTPLAPLSAPGGHPAPARKKEPPRAPAAPKAAPAPAPEKPVAAPEKPAAAPEKPAAAPEKPAAPTPSEPKPDSPIPENPF
jgi:serine/threonine protein phosphatase PrpC